MLQEGIKTAVSSSENITSAMLAMESEALLQGGTPTGALQVAPDSMIRSRTDVQGAQPQPQ